jgi:hypothetical protein
VINKTGNQTWQRNRNNMRHAKLLMGSENDKQKKPISMMKRVGFDRNQNQRASLGYKPKSKSKRGKNNSTHE